MFNFTAISSERVCRSENWLENCNEPRKFVTETTPMQWMRTLQHSCYSKPSHVGYLPLSRELSRIFLSESANSPLKEWGKHLNFKKWKWEYCLVTWAHKALFWRKEKISATLLLKVVVLLEKQDRHSQIPFKSSICVNCWTSTFFKHSYLCKLFNQGWEGNPIYFP